MPSSSPEGWTPGTRSSPHERRGAVVGFRTVEEQLETILAVTSQHPPVTIPLADARGRTLGADVRAVSAVPPFDNSAMDGFAVHYSDVVGAAADRQVALRVIADVPAGSALDPAIEAGETARIMTGAPLPADADTIVPFEDTVGGLADSLAEAL